MIKVVEKTAASVEDALQAALDELGVTAEQVEVEVLEKPTKKLFGLLGSSPAKIKVTLKENLQPKESEVVETEQIAEPVVEENFSAVEETPATEEVEEKISDEVAEETPAVEINKEELIDKAKKFLADVFAEMKIDVQVTAKEFESGVVLDLSGENLGVLIGKHGQTLDALQYLTNLAANRNDTENRLHFILDVENYRERRAETLQKLAKSVADRAVRMRQDVKLEPMNRHERRLIHTALQDNDKVDTRSAGEEPYRYIIVSPRKRNR